MGDLIGLLTSLGSSDKKPSEEQKKIMDKLAEQSPEMDELIAAILEG